MTDCINLLEENIKNGQIWMKPLADWNKTVIFSLLTLGIYFIYIFIKRIERADKYIMRKRDFFNIVINCFQKNPAADLKGLQNTRALFIKDVPPLKPFLLKLIFVFCILSVTLSIVIYRLDGSIANIAVITGIFLLTALFIYIYRMNKIWDDIGFFENMFYAELEKILKKERIFKNSFLYETQSKMKDKFIPYLFLSLFPVPFLWLLVWDRKLHYLPDKIYPSSVSSEYIILETLKSRC